MRRFLALALVAALACTSATPGPSPPVTDAITAAPPAVDMTDVLARTKVPGNDLFALTRRLRHRDGTPGPWEPVSATVPDRQVGERATFFFYNQRTKANEQLSAVLQQRTDHAYWYVQENVRVDPGRLTQSALDFESRVYPTDRRLFGEEWTPGIDNDPRLTILLARIPDVGGYFSSADEYPRWINHFSSEREMIYVNVDGAPPGSSFLQSTLAHEFAHMIAFATRHRSVIWFNEGVAQLAEHAIGSSVGTVLAFVREPDTQLTDWAEEPADAAPHYGHAFLFLEYLSERFGGTELIRVLLQRDIDTPLDLEPVLQQHGAASIRDVYLDFVATNALLDQAKAPAPYRYAQVRPPAGARVARERPLEVGEARRASVHQYATRYFELPAGRLAIDFQGTAQVRLLPTEPHSGRWLWWSNRADQVNTSLTRKVDLRGVKAATLTFWSWFDIEEGFDYAYVDVSDDAGSTWRSLSGGLTTEMDPNGANLGSGITARSGGGTTPRWVEERMDLSPFAGKEILLRFDYVTDQALNKDGLGLDDIAIPELGWRDDAEADGDWRAAGFVRSSNAVRERFALQVITLGDTPGVSRTLVGADGRARLEVDVPERGTTLLAVTAFAPQTTQPGAFQLAVERR